MAEGAALGEGTGLAAQARRAVPAAFASAMFLSAALIFALQPMFARLVTPMLGGSPSVWNTSMVFFQAALLAGYFYAHVLQRVRDMRDQAAIHALVLIGGLLVLPVSVTTLLGAPSSAHPAAWLLGVLALSIGAPFAAAAATAPLLQAWYARSGRPDAHDPYYLYAASNAGSFGGLLLYPILVEPLLGAGAQSLAWTNLYAVAAALIVLCGFMTFVSNPAGRLGEEAATTSEAPSWRQRLFWLGAAALPSSLLLGVTQHITTDVASAPFLWVAPLALYLVTFIVAFMRGGEKITPFVLILHPLAIVALAITQIIGNAWPISLTAHLAAFLMSALVCHLALARTRPASDRLTEFYLWVSLGGVVGGALTALVAPVVFNGIYEYPLALAAIALFRPLGETPLPRLSTVLAVAAFTMVGVVWVTLTREPSMTMLFGGGLGAAAALAAAALPQGMSGGPFYRMGFIAAALVFAAIMTYAAVRPDDFIAAQGAQNLALARGLKLGALIFGFLTFAFVVHTALQDEDPERPQPYANILLGVATPLLLMAVIFAANDALLDARGILNTGLGFATIALFVCRNRPRLFAGIILALFAMAFMDEVRGARVVAQQRSFFGVLRVEELPLSPTNSLRILMHGTTIHGAQLTQEGLSRQPLTYYHPETSLGEATLAGLSGGVSSSIALVGMGAGSTACLTRPRDRLTIYEIDPTVVRMSGPNGSVFSYIKQCQPNARIELGDARLRIAQAPNGSFDVIVLDAFSSDAIPAHLLTREAVAMYMRKLSPRGILVLHLSNRNLALVEEAARVAASLDLPNLWRVSDRVENSPAGPYGGLPASSMILAADQRILDELPLQHPWAPAPTPPGRPWTDDYINLPRALWQSWVGRD